MFPISFHYFHRYHSRFHIHMHFNDYYFKLRWLELEPTDSN